MLKAVLFDFDGTLADTGHIMFKAYEKLGDKYELPAVNHDEIDQIRALSIRDRFKKAGVPIFKMPAILRETKQVYADHINTAKPFPGSAELLKSIKDRGLLLSIISSNTEKNIISFLTAHKLDYFDHIRTTSSLFGKHRAIKGFLNELRLKPEEAIYIGDELRDIIACKKVPIRVVAVTWGYDHITLLKDAKPDFLAEKPDDILAVLDEL